MTAEALKSKDLGSSVKENGGMCLYMCTANKAWDWHMAVTGETAAINSSMVSYWKCKHGAGQNWSSGFKKNKAKYGKGTAYSTPCVTWICRPMKKEKGVKCVSKHFKLPQMEPKVRKKKPVTQPPYFSCQKTSGADDSS